MASGKSSSGVSSSHNSSVSLSEDESDVAFNFYFVRDVESDISDVVRLGALGRFAEARSVVEHSLEAVDNIAPIAIEIMRLMYDQGDFAQLHEYISAFLAEQDSRTYHDSWTSRGLCILYLMHDICVASFGNVQDFVTTTPDLSKAGLDIESFQEMDDEQIMTLVLIVRIAYMRDGVVGPPIVTRSTLPSILRDVGGLHRFLEYLLGKQSYWAAAHIMATCIQLSDVDFATLWISASGLFQGALDDGDEPTLCFRVILLHTYMEGLLCRGLAGLVASDSSQSMLPSWRKLVAERYRFVVSLKAKVGADIWTSSREYARWQILDLDKRILERNARNSRTEGIGDRTELLRLKALAGRNHDLCLLEGIHWRTKVLVDGQDPRTITSVQCHLALPIEIYFKRHELPRVAARSSVQPGHPIATNPMRLSSAPFVQAASSPRLQRPPPSLLSVELPVQHVAMRPIVPLARNDIAIQSTTQLGEYMSTHTLAFHGESLVAPPWQNSQILGGHYVWSPQTDEIILETGRRYPRPENIPTSALSRARYVGPLPFEYGGSPPAIPGSMLRPGQAKAQGVNQAQKQPVPRGRNLQAFNNTVGQLSLEPQAGPSARPPLVPQAGGSRQIHNVDPRRDTHAYIQPPTRSQIARREPARQVDGHGQSVQLGAQAAAVTRSLFPSFKVRADARKYFKVGKVFLILWSENAGEPTNGTVATAWHPGIVLNQLGERVFSKVRRFVVIREGAKWCHALPISTYGGKGVAKSGVVKSEHVIIHTARNPPTLGQGEQPKRNEPGMRPVPIRAEPDIQGVGLDPMSRLNLGGVTLIQHNIKVEHFGRVARASMNELLTQFGNVWGHEPVPAPQRLLPSAEGDDVFQDESDSDEEEDDEGESDADDSD